MRYWLTPLLLNEGLGGRAILNLGLFCKKVFPQTQSVDPMAGQIAYVVGFFVALIMWSWG